MKALCIPVEDSENLEDLKTHATHEIEMLCAVKGYSLGIRCKTCQLWLIVLDKVRVYT